MKLERFTPDTWPYHEAIGESAGMNRFFEVGKAVGVWTCVDIEADLHGVVVLLEKNEEKLEVLMNAFGNGFKRTRPPSKKEIKQGK